MKEQEVRLISYRKEIEVLTLTMDIPYYEDSEKRAICGTYEATLLKLFNNKRDNKEILEIRNYYGSNKITLVIDFTSYMNGSEEDRNNSIVHLKEWFAGSHDININEIEAKLDVGYIYEVSEFENDFTGINNFIVQDM